MERLKAALDKARETRAATAASAPASAARPNPAAKPAPRGNGHAGAVAEAVRGPQAAGSGPTLYRGSCGDVEAAWADIPKSEIDPRRLVKRRLISFGRQAEATAFDVLRTKVLQVTGANGWKRVAITSPLPGSGKTTTSINLAVALARQVDLRIILVDLDMRRPAVARSLGISGKTGVAPVLEGRESFGRQARRLGDNLAIAMNFAALRDPSDLFLRARTSEVLDEIEATYRPDLILFDMPPLLVNDDASAFLRNVDCALMVAEAGATTVSQVDVCEKELAEQTNVLGVVLNKCRFFSDGYYRYYHAYGDD
ncbi:MAG: CpsD/CapB family tyrosine-protein kinase [Paracoccaceae bacterium]|jgi:capsular exopolysaccharide synthesis family protein|nr:CpsD/CapB family tyrosine-protein kinase [Paracoccaceae bacterium]